jgi:hypothetical protein
MEDRPYIVAVDFDATLSQKAVWTGVRTDPLPPSPGMPELLRELRDIGCQIIIWTCRSEPKEIKKWCEKYNVPFDAINENVHETYRPQPKIFADVYLDDKALFYDGKSTLGLLGEILKRKREWQDSGEA